MKLILSLFLLISGLAYSQATQPVLRYNSSTPEAINIIATGAVPNVSSFDNYSIVQAAINKASVSGTCAVFVPAGHFYVSRGFNIPNCVKLYGTASLSSTSPSTSVSYGSSFVAMPGFTGPTYGFNGVSPYPGKFMVYIDGSTSLIGYPGSTVTTETDTYGAQAYNITFDCNFVSTCNGGFVGHRNENSTYHDLTFANWTTYGFFDCGAGTGGAGPGGNTPCGPASGDNGGGPDERIQVVSYGSQITSASWPVVFLQAFDRGINDWTINTSAGPLYDGYMSIGPGTYVDAIHMESGVNGLWFGPSSGFCATLGTSNFCNGSSSIKVTEISEYNGQGGSVVINDKVTNATYQSITYDGGGTGSNNTFNDLHNSIAIAASSTAYVGFYSIDNSGTPWNTDHLMQAAGELYIGGTGSLQIQSTNTPQFRITYGATPFYGQQFTVDSTGSMNVIAPGSNPGNWAFTKANAILSGIGTSSQYNGWNIQGLVAATVGSGDSSMIQNGAYCSNAYWSTSALQWVFGNIGGTGYACSFGTQSGGWGISTSNAGQPGTATNTQFLSNVRFYMNPAGNLLVGSGAITRSATGAALDVIGNATISGSLTVASCSGCGGSGGGSVTSFSAPSGSWPTWLVPTVTASTTAPSLAVAATAQGNGGKVQLSTGSTTTNDCVKFDSNGNTIDAGAACGSGSMTYPGAGIANSTGSAWGTSYTTSGSGTVLALTNSPTLVTPNLGTPSAINLTNATGFPTLNQNTTGNAATATALAATPTPCSAGYAPTGVLANGNSTGCASISGASLPSQTGFGTGGYFLTTNGSAASWGIIPTLGSGGMTCTSAGCDIVTTVVPTLFNAQMFKGQNTFGTGSVATSSTNYNSQPLGIGGNYWNGTAGTANLWTWQDVLGSGTNPTSTLTLAKPSGTSGTASVSIPFPISVTSCTGCGIATYMANGTVIANAHSVIGSGVASGYTYALSFSGSAAFSGSTTYVCLVSDTDNGSYAYATINSGTSVTLHISGSAGADHFSYQCTGN